MYKLTSIGDVFEFIDRRKERVIKVGSFDDCCSVIESIIDGSTDIE